jgi:general L-amino acid transport system permease protein
MLLPSGATVDKLLRAQLAIVLFVSAYIAEIVRAGLPSLPPGQEEAARALGLSWWRTMRLVVLPQALRTVVPAFVTLAIGIFLDTTLVIVIGLFDFLNTAKLAATDPAWLGFYDESFAFAGTVYFLVCFAASRYSLWLERRLARP